MEYFAPLVTIFVVSFLGWLTPGPNMIAVISTSMANGRQTGLATGLGLGMAATLWTLLAVFGVAALFELFPWIARLLKIFGAGYLIWLGLSSIKNSQIALTPQEMETIRPQQLSLSSAFIRGLTVSMTNPKAALFYGSILSAVVPPNSTIGFLFIVIVFSGGLALLFHSITALVFSTGRAMQFFVDSRQNIEKLFGFLFIGIGGAVFYDAWRR